MQRNADRAPGEQARENVPSHRFRNSTSQLRNPFVIPPSSSAITSRERRKVHLALNAGGVIVTVGARFAGAGYGAEDCGVPVGEERGAIAAGGGGADAEVESPELIPAAPIGAEEGLSVGGVRIEGHSGGWEGGRGMVAAGFYSRIVAVGLDGDRVSRTSYSVIEMLCLQIQKQQTLSSLFVILLPL